MCSQLGLGQAEVARGGIESAEPPAVVEAGPRAAEQRHVAGFDPLLELGALGVREAARRNCGVDAVLERLLQGGAERARLDAELLGRVLQDRLVFLLGRAQLRGRERGAAAGDRETSDGPGDQLWLPVAFHRDAPFVGIGTSHRTTGV